ncbi:acyltransferase family protein [Limimaricola sp.]|uniref:acyltransferase family protein n=1 Tax=Limimaricola sp. TaxID=2211665 RepID=UPI0040581E75
MPQLSYRADIDGLRAVAVVPVVLFHLGVPAMAGGFVGVDVFFVISGFLITSIIRREIAEGQFSILRFYDRRVRRILPALFVTIAVTLAISSLLQVPKDLLNTAQSAVAATLFASNVLFFLESGYFDASAYSKPLLHSWSLAIEEQFYILLPLLMIAVSRRRFGATGWIAAITLASFLLSAFATRSYPSAAYYLLPWRAWELGIGALLACVAGPALAAPALRGAVAGLGLLLILGAVLLIDAATPFPGVAALAPVAGTAMIIHAGRFGPSPVSRLLGAALPVWIGKLSYSLYLWHWPVIVFFVYWRFDMPDLVEGTALFALSLAAAALSLRYVERPFRKPGGPVPGLRLFAGAGATAALLLAVSGGLVLSRGLPGRLPSDLQRIAAFSEDFDPRSGPCFYVKTEEESWLEPCIYGDVTAGPPKVALWGDSHAPALVPALDQAGLDAGASVALYAKQGCPGFTDFQVYWTGNDHDCSRYLDEIIPAILNDPSIEVVVLSFRTPIYTQGWLDYGLAERGRRSITIGSRAAPLSPVAIEARLALFLDRLDGAVTALQAAGKRVILVYPTPEAGVQVPSALLRQALWQGAIGDLALPRDVFDARTARSIAGFDRLAERHGLTTVRLDRALCDDQVCRLVQDGIPVFRDNNHLSATAARNMAPHFRTVFETLRERGT